MLRDRVRRLKSLPRLAVWWRVETKFMPLTCAATRPVWWMPSRSNWPSRKVQAAGEASWPLQQRAIAAIEKASERGIDVAFDFYPWLAGSTVLTQVLPQD